MNSFYVIRDSNAIADVTPVGHKLCELTRINVPKAHRRKGVGTALLRQVCSAADGERVTLQLFINAYNDGGLNAFELISWYKRHGFEVVGDVTQDGQGTRMKRLPR